MQTLARELTGTNLIASKRSVITIKVLAIDRIDLISITIHLGCAFTEPGQAAIDNGIAAFILGRFTRAMGITFTSLTPTHAR
jgi:hypothetical protein